MIQKKDKSKTHIIDINNKTNEVICMVFFYNSAPWKVKIVFKGDAYGLNNCRTHDEDKPMVEFYDLAHKEIHGDGGQFVSRYYLGSILLEGRCIISREDFIKAGQRDPEIGILLDAGITNWRMSGTCLTEVLDEIKILFIKNMLAPHYKKERDNHAMELDEETEDA